MVDLSLMGHLASKDYIGAVALGGMIFNFIYAVFSFFRMGTSGFTAQAFGRNDHTEIRLVFQRSMMFALVTGMMLILLQYPINSLGFYLIKGGHAVEALASEYFYIRIYAAPATLGLYALNGWFLGLQNARIPMTIAITINVLNIGLNLFFVKVLGMKSDGVALGTLFAQYAGLAMGLFFIVKHHYAYIRIIRLREIIDLNALRIFFSVNKDIFIRTVLLISTFSFFTAKSAQFGDTMLAVNTLLLQFFMIFSYLIDGFAYAAEALTGKYIGAGAGKPFKKVVLLLFCWGLAISALFTVVYVSSGKYILYIMTDNPEIIEASRPYMFWVALVPLITFASFLWDGIFIGATASKPMRNTMLIATLLVFLPCYYILTPLLNNHGLWLSLMSFMLVRGLLMTIYSKNSIMRKYFVV